MADAPKTPERILDCSGCSLCCEGDGPGTSPGIVLHPEDGDDISLYDTEIRPYPIAVGKAFGTKVHVLKANPDGSCIYLKSGVCSIYDHRPVICRGFSCVDMFKRLGQMPAAKRAQYTKDFDVRMRDRAKMLIVKGEANERVS